MALYRKITNNDGKVVYEKVVRLTPEELQDVCHGLTGEDYKAFCDGCDVEQRRLFGKCRTDDLRKAFEGDFL